MGKPLTHKQGSLLFKLTLRKFWEHPTPPTIREASDLISVCLDAVKDRADAGKLQAAVDMVRRWYPDFGPDDLKEALAGIQQLDPPGVGARDIRECFLMRSLLFSAFTLITSK